MGLKIIATNHYPWRDKNDTNNGTQIDLIIDRAKNVLHICEMKFAIGKYTIDKAYSNVLRDKLAIYQSSIKTKKNNFINDSNNFWTCKK